ncbi:hypothetical protein J6Z19_08895 [bacterium]|nr:hypothetical protein [bacterium]
MTLYKLKQVWCGKPYENLSVSCDFSATKEAVTAVFDITEPSVKAVYSETNQKVFEDSCAELFLSFGSGFYYNFEVNCIGTVLAQYGKNRCDREFLNPQLIKNIEVLSTLGSKPFGIKDEETSYRLEIKIPKTIFVFDNCGINPELLKGNIYKCADCSPTPHYMHLFDIISEKPDFHRPGFFRKLI